MPSGDQCGGQGQTPRGRVVAADVRRLIDPSMFSPQLTATAMTPVSVNTHASPSHHHRDTVVLCGRLESRGGLDARETPALPPRHSCRPALHTRTTHTHSEMWRAVLSHLPPGEVMRVRRVNHLFYTVALDHQF